VRPLVRQASEPVAYLLVDALRYEMAEALREALTDEKHLNLTLRPYAAELPTVTAVGMNALAPVARGGRLTPVWRNGAITGFKPGEYAVEGPDDRKRAMAEALGSPTLPWLSLAETADASAAQLRQRLQRAMLVVVHSTELDDGGEKNVGPEVFDTVLRRLRTALMRLREAGVKRAVVTADHGFLLRRGVAATLYPDGPRAFGSRGDTQRRHAVWRAEKVEGCATVPFAHLRYDDDGDRHLLLAPEVQVFDRGDRLDDFVHGGDSPQERVIPVLALDFRGTAPPAADADRYRLDLRQASPMMGLECLRLQPRPAEQMSLGFVAATHLELVFVPEAPDAAEPPAGVVLEVVHVRGEGARW
jgi:hypothetical protein